MSMLQGLHPTLFRTLFFFSMLAFLAFGAQLAHAQETAPDTADSNAYTRVADVLEDPATREVLIEQLRQLAADGDTLADPEAGSSVSSLPRRIAGLTQSFAEGVVTEGYTALSALSDASRTLAASDPATLGAELLGFVILVVATLVVLWLLARLAAIAFRALDRFASRDIGGPAVLRRAFAIIAAVVIHLFVIILTWFAGYGIALFVIGTPGEMSMQESLFLNAFLVIELVRAVIRTVFSNRYHGLRLVPATSENATYWSAWATRMLIFLGYGLLLVVPLINVYIAPEVGRVAALIIMFMAFLKAAVIVMQNRLKVRALLDALANRMQTPFARVSLGMASRLWHIVAIAYLGSIFITAILYPERALPFMIAATVQTLIATAIGVAISVFLTGVILRRIQLPDETRARFPLLEQRLNAYIPTALKITRFTILAIVVAVIFDAWTLFDLGAWITSDAGARFIGKLVAVALIIAMAVLVWLVIASWIEYKLGPNSYRREPSARTATLLTIFRNATAITLVVLTVMVVLAEIGVNIGPLIAGAGVLGLAIGFGAQKLVQDVITGVFIQLEDGINVGDVVTAAGMTATVEKMTIRSLGMRDLAGTYHLIPFSSVDTVSNYMRDHGFHLGEYRVAYREDTDTVIEHLEAAFEELRNDPEHAPSILDDLEVHGISELNENALKIRIRIKTLPGMQFPIGRAYNRVVKRHFDAAGIEIPYPHMRLYFGENRDGSAPPAKVRMLDGEGAPQEPQRGRTHLDAPAAGEDTTKADDPPAKKD